MQKKLSIILKLLLASVILMFTSCEIGLGEAVDTEPPSLEIACPVSDAVIRDAFRLAGTWSDDGSIAELTVTLERTDGTKVYGPFAGTVIESEDDNQPNTWFCEIYPKDPKDASFDVVDGSYVATVAITDEGKHTTIMTRQFTIDNTAPIIVLQRPSSKSSVKSEKEVDSYGQTFTLEGQAADDNNVNLIRVNIYADEACTQLVHYVDLNNVPPTISLDVAKFAEGVDNDYSRIYGSTTKNGTKQLYCKVVAYDGAQRYPVDGSNQSAEDTRGNATSTYYLYEDIATSILSNHKITEVYHMLNGNYLLVDTSRSADTVNNIASALNENVVTAGTFSLNPANNPTFSVSGRDPLTKTDGLYAFTANDNVSNGGNVVIEVAVGLDGIPLKADSLKVFVQHYNGDGTVDGDKIFPETEAPTKSGTSYKFVVPLSTSSGLVIGQNYLFGVEGTDQNGNPVVASGAGWGFHLASSGAAPTLNVTSPSNTISYLSKGSTALFEGDVYSEEGGATISILIGDNVVWSQTFPESNGHFSYEIPAGSGGFDQSTSNQYAYTVSATQNGLATTVNRTVLYDVEGPTINIDSMLPTASKYKDDESGATEPGEYLNGDVTLKLSIVDDYDTVDTTTNRPYFEIVDASTGTVIPCKVDSESAPAEKHYITSPAKQSIVIHTTDIDNSASGKAIKIRIYAWDRAGNSYYDYINDKAYFEKDYTVDQSTDKPVILPNNKDSLSLKKTDWTAGKNSFQTGSQMYLKLIDDDGIKQVTIKCGEDTVADTDLPVFNDNTPFTTYQNEMVYSVALPSDSKKYKMVVEVVDKNDVTTTSAVFAIRVTAAFPTIKSVTTIPEYVTTNITDITSTASKKFTNKIGTTGTEYPFYIFRKTSEFVTGDIPSDKPAVDANEDFVSSPALGSDVTFVVKYNGDYEDIITPAVGDTTTTYYYKLMDKNWNPSNVEHVECKIDNTAPTGTFNIENFVPAKKTTDGNLKDWYNSSSIRFNVTVTDEAIDTVEATIAADPRDATADYQMFSLSGENFQGSMLLEKGENTVWLRMTDKAGNIGYESTVVYVDIDEPTLTVTEDTVLDYMPATGFDIKGTAIDATPSSGAVILTVKEEFKAKGNANYIETTDSTDSAKNTISVNAADGEWTLHVPLAGTPKEDGDYRYTFTLKDPVGNFAPQVLKTTTVDTTEPELNMPAEKTVNSAIDETTYKFESTFIEEHIIGVYYYIGSDTETIAKPNSGKELIKPTTWTNAGWTAATCGTGKWNFYQSFKSNDSPSGTVGLGEGKYKLFVCAVDGAENSSDIKEVRFDVDMANPVLTEAHSTEGSSTININADNSSDGLVLSGTADDTNRLDKIEIKQGANTYVIALNTTNGKYESSDEVTYNETSKEWKRTFTTGAGKDLVDGTYDFTITATDMVGKTSEIKRKVVIDTVKPTVDANHIITPSALQTENTLFKFEGESGVVADTGTSSGFDRIDILFTSSSTTPEAGATPSLTVTPNASTGVWSSTIEFAAYSTVFGTKAAPNQGEKYIWLKVYDKAGNSSDWTSKSFHYDTASPSIEEETVAKDGTYANTTFILSGTATDTNGIYSVTIEAENDNTTGTNKYTFTDSTLTNDATDGNKKVTWSKTFTLAAENATGNPIADGSYTFTIYVEDLSGKTGKTVRKMVVDTTTPQISTKTIKTTAKTISDVDWYNTKNLSIEVVADDAKLSGIKSSGVASVSYSTVAYDEADPTKDRNWADLTYSANKFTGNVQLSSDGKDQKIYLRVKDTAGNTIGEKDNTQYISCNIDSTAPNTASVIKVNGEEGVTSKLVNGRNDLVLQVTAADAGTDNTGIKSVDVSGIGITPVTAAGSPKKSDGTAATAATADYWEVTIPKANLTSGNIVLKILDNADNQFNYTSDVQLSFDNKAPESRKITLPDDADSETTDVDVNKTFEISGTTSDNQTIASVDICYYIDATPANKGDFTGKSWIHYKSIGADFLTSWTTGNIDSTTLFKKVPDGTAIYFVPVILDKAHNCNLDTKSGDNTVTEHHVADGTGFIPKADVVPANLSGTNIAKVILNQDSDRPIITISNLTCSNTDGKMSSTNRVWHKTSDLHGTVSDDDGNVKEVHVSIDNGATWSNNLYLNGMWTYPITSDINGAKDIMFKVVDAKDTEFVSAETVNAYAPKLKDTESTPNKYGYKGSTEGYSILYTRLDTVQPAISSVYYITSNPGIITNAILENPETNGWKAISEIDQHWIGGPSSELYVMFTASDKNGIKSTSHKIGELDSTRYYPPSEPYDIDTTSITQIVKFNTSTVNSGSLAKLSLTATDYSDTVYERTPDTLKVDNEPPVISISSHGDAAIVYGSLDVVVNGTTRDDNGVKELWYAVTKDKDSVPAAESFVKYTNETPFAWSLKFDGKLGNNADSTANHIDFLNTYLDNLYGADTSKGDDTKDVYLWVYAVDGNLNNFGTSGYSDDVTKWSAENNTARQCINLKVIPQADKPTVKIDYPGEGTTVGGTIRLSGSTNIMTDSVKAVWIQIDPNYDENTKEFHSTWTSDLTTLITGKAPGYTIVTEAGAGIAADDTTPGSTLKAGIKASGTVQNWNLIINQDSEFKKMNGAEETTRTIAVRAYAVSNENHKISNVYETYFTIDPNAPRFNPDLKLEKNGDATVSVPYTSGAWINGEWYIVGNVQHGAGIKTLKFGNTFLVQNGEAVSGSNAILTQRKSDSYNAGHTAWNWDFKIPVGTAISGDFGENKFTLESVDNGQNKTASLDILVKYDNKAPSSFLPKLNTIPLTLTNNNFQQSNGSMTVSGTIDESGRESGLERIAFYFVRDIKDGATTTRYFIDPLVTKVKTGETETPAKFRNNYVAVGTVDADGSVTPASGIVYEDGIYWRSTTGASVSGKTLTVTPVPNNVRIGGLCKINKVVYRIDNISDTTITLNTTLNDASDLKVYFALGQVIDNTVIETGKTDLYDPTTADSMSNGDGDWMVEGIGQSGTTYSWQASINSKNMYDGPVTLNFTYYDKAGNFGSASYKGMVSNNAPRLAGVKVGTDYNGDDNLDDDEGEVSFTNAVPRTIGGASVQKSSLVTENLIVSSNNKLDGYAFMTVKDAVMFIPEIIGGNGNLYYSYEIGQDISQPEKAGANTTSFAVGRDDNDEYTAEDSEKRIYVKTHNGEAGYTVPKIIVPLDEMKNLKNSYKNAPTWFKYKIWDSTDGTVVGTDSVASWTSQYATMQVALAVNVRDNTAPKVVVEPFFWNSASDNSLYENSYMNGHIWLEKDIPDAYTDTTGGKDKDPKVSGKIAIRGTAYDDHKLSTIWVKFDAFTPNVNDCYADSKDANDYYKVATFNPETKEWTSHAVTAANGDVWKFTVTPVYNDKRGHKVKWELDIDTSSIANQMGNDKNVSVIAIDAASEAHTSDLIKPAEDTSTILDGDEVYQEPQYRMDVVPYISGIRDADGNEAPRSRLGRYSVRTGKEVTITGFNFSTQSKPEVYRSLSTNGTANEIAGDSARALDVGTCTEKKITVTVPAYSGYIRVLWGDVFTPNNSNENNVGYNIQKGYVASDKVTLGKKAANKAGSEFWTDDVYLSVWNVAESSLFAGSINPHSGAIKKIDKYNSGSGAPQNVDGSVAATGPGGGYIYKQPEDKTEVTPETNMNDSYYGAISSDDLKLYGYVSGRNYASHGDNIAFNSSEVAYVAPVDEMDYTIVNGTPYYVMQDNGLGGDSGSVWGLGLCMMREGIWYDRGYFNPYKGNTIEENKVPFIIEKQGSNVASHNRDPSTGYDSVLYQFKNPRITGWYNANDSLLYSKENGDKSVKGVDYIYISYYDSYAKCLKYAAYRVGHRFASNDSKYANSYLKYWGKIDMPKDIDIVAEMTTSPMTTQNQTAQKAYNHLTDGAAVVAGHETTSNNPTYTEIAGEWSDIFVDTTGTEPRPVIIYYNKTAKSLEVAYGNNSFPQKTAEWTKSTGIRPAGVTADFGRYVSAAMDVSGNLHVAAQDADNAKLYYLCLKKSGSTYFVANSVAVDSASGAGRWTDIELTNREGTTLKDMKPVISYIDTGFLGTTKGIKAAYLEDVDGDDLVFEAMTDPAYYISTDQRTSVMSNVKETKAGTIKAPVAVGFNADMLALDFLRDEQ